MARKKQLEGTKYWTLTVREKPLRLVQVGAEVEVEDGGLVCGWIEAARRTRRSCGPMQRLVKSLGEFFT